MAEIQLCNVSKRWGGFVGVENLDLRISDREYLVLLGPSGCGRTTTMRKIAGLEEASDGEILIDGKAVTGFSPKDRDVAMVFHFIASILSEASAGAGPRLHTFAASGCAPRVGWL